VRKFVSPSPGPAHVRALQTRCFGGRRTVLMLENDKFVAICPALVFSAGRGRRAGPVDGDPLDAADGCYSPTPDARYDAPMSDDNSSNTPGADSHGEAAVTPPLYQSKAGAGQALPPGAGFVYLGSRGEWLIDLNAERRRAEAQAAELRRCTAPDWPGELPHEVQADAPWSVTLFDGVLHVSYSQVYVESQVAAGEACPEYDIPQHFAGQHNGLCGGALTGRLCLMTATHTGPVPLAVELHAAQPPLDAQWEDVVEVSFQVEPWRVAILPLLSFDGAPLPLPRGHYRLRCCARGMQAGWDVESPDGEERYLWQFWRSTGREADRIVRVGSERARYLHGEYGGRA